MMLRTLASLLALGGSILLLDSCTSKACTLIGCASSVEANFRGVTTTAGVYQVEIVADATPSSCQITLPFACSKVPDCSTGVTTWQLKLSGCGTGGTASLDGFSFFSDPPAKIDFVIRRDGEVIGGGSASPTYQVSYPNGPDCGECRSAPAFDVDLM